MKKSRYLQRVISAMLLLAMVICLLPTNVIALPQETAEATAQLNSGFSEVTSLREENVKHFSLGNGTYQAVVYGHPVHYQDENGVWQDIDNTLTLQTVNGNRQYANDRVAFAQSYRADSELMRLQKGDYSISMQLIPESNTSVMARSNVTAANAAVTNANKQITSIDQAMNASWSSNVKYENVLTNVDLEYIVDYDYIKENIIVKAPRASYDFSFRLNLEGMYATLLSDGSVGIYSNETNEMEYAIPTPYMYDARGRFSDAVTYSLTGASGKYVLTVSADEAWMKEDDRAFPVTIDPTYTTTCVSLDHTYTSAFAPSATQEYPSVLWVGAYETTYIKPSYNIAIPSNMDLISAALKLHYFFDMDEYSEDVPVAAYEMLYEWDENEASYNSMSQLPNYGKGSTMLDWTVCSGGIGATATSPLQVSFDVTEVMAGWLDGEEQNGVVLDYYFDYSYDISDWSVGFYSIFAQYAYRPLFSYKYTSLNQFVHYYDSTFAYTSYIPAAVTFVNKAYSDQFGLQFSSSGDPAEWTNEEMNRYICENDGTECLMGTSTHIHSGLVADALYAKQRAANQISVLWTDRPGKYCYHGSGECEIESFSAIVYDHRPAIHIWKTSEFSLSLVGYDQIQAYMGIVLTHETAHTLGMNDVYFDGHDITGGWHCVMEKVDWNFNCTNEDYMNLTEFYEAVLQGYAKAFCGTCEHALRFDVYL